MGTVWALTVLFVITGLSEGVAWPAISAMTADKGRIYGMGGLMGLREIAMAVGLLTRSLVGGLLAEAFTLGIVFRLSGLAMIGGALAFAYLARDYVPESRANASAPLDAVASPDPAVGPPLIDDAPS